MAAVFREPTGYAAIEHDNHHTQEPQAMPIIWDDLDANRGPKTRPLTSGSGPIRPLVASSGHVRPLTAGSGRVRPLVAGGSNVRPLTAGEGIRKELSWFR